MYSISFEDNDLSYRKSMRHNRRGRLSAGKYDFRESLPTSIRFTPDMRKKIENHSLETNKPMTVIVMDALSAYFNQN